MLYRRRLVPFVALLALCVCVSCGKPSAGGGPVALSAGKPGSIVGKWASEGKAGHVPTHSTLEFAADGKFTGDEQIAPQVRRVESGTYTLEGTNLTRKQAQQKLIKKGQEEKVSPTKVTIQIKWTSPDEFTFPGAEAAPWKRVK